MPFHNVVIHIIAVWKIEIELIVKKVKFEEHITIPPLLLFPDFVFRFPKKNINACSKTLPLLYLKAL